MASDLISVKLNHTFADVRPKSLAATAKGKSRLCIQEKSQAQQSIHLGNLKITARTDILYSLSLESTNCERWLEVDESATPFLLSQ